MTSGGSEEKKLLCCFVVANKRNYDFYALDLSKDSGEGDDQNYELGDGGDGDDGKYIPPEVEGDDLSDVHGEDDDLYYRRFVDIPPVMNHLPHVPDPFLTIPKIRFGYENWFPHRMAFGLLGGMLYMVSPYGKVHVFDTRDITSSPGPLDHNVCVTIGPALNAPKQDPLVIPLAGKLFVFCCSLYPDPEYTEHVIEVLVPENKCWSPIQLPPTLIEYAKANPWKVEDLYLPRNLNPYLIESHATVGSSIVLCLSMCVSHNIELFVLDAETLSWKIRVDHPHITKLPFRGVCLFLDGIWCSGKGIVGVHMKEEGMEDKLQVPLPPSKELYCITSVEAVRVDDTTVLGFSYGMKFQRYCNRCPDYFKVDMLRVDKRKRDKDGVEKLTLNVVETKDFFFKKYNPDFQLAYCYYLSY